MIAAAQSKEAVTTTAAAAVVNSLPLILTPEEHNHGELTKFANRFYTDKRMVIITGAGISVSAGIPVNGRIRSANQFL